MTVGAEESHALRRSLCLVVTVLFLAAPAAALASSPAFTPAPSSPLVLPGSNEGNAALSPGGGLLAVGTEMFSVGGSGALTPVGGEQLDPSARSVAFSPNGTLLVATNARSDTVSMFSVDASGVLASVPGSPFTVGAQPVSVTFSPSGNLLAVAAGESLYMFTVGASGGLTPLAGSPIGVSASQVAFSPAGGLLAALGSGVTMFSVSSSGALTEVSGSPFDAFGAAGSGMAFGPSGNLLAVSNFSGGVTMYSVASSGALTPIGSGPFDPALQTNSVAFSPNGSTVAATQNDWSGVVAFSVASSGALSVLPGSPFATPAPAKNVAFGASGALVTATIDSAVADLVPSSTSSATDWLGAFGSDGYDLAAWDGQSDVSDLPNVSVSLVKGSRYVWAVNTSDTRALPGPDGLTRTAATYYDPGKLQVKLTFQTAYTGSLRLYAVDWDGSVGCCKERRETITVGSQSVGFASQHYGAFHQGEWATFPVSEPAGGSVTITATHEIGANAVLSGIFLGGEGAPQAIESTSAPQGTWVGAYGSAGYDLGAWNGMGDLTSMPNAAVSLVQGGRFVWASSTKDVRALESPDGSTRAATTYFSTPNQLRLALRFNSAYNGNLHLYAVDWDKRGRRELVSVGGQTAALSSDFSQGAWLTFPISAAAGETVPIVVDRTAGVNAVLSGIFLG